MTSLKKDLYHRVEFQLVEAKYLPWEGKKVMGSGFVEVKACFLFCTNT
ncbi:hypothetical protein [Rickettsia oklahomensis]|uniref:Uncharacterized protein n=1 Tax=Rickettsia oklahomensis TaxID=3141789 RepID=A0AAU7BZA4_9RICK